MSSLYSQEYINHLKERGNETNFPNLTEKTNEDIIKLLRKNAHRANYNQEFDLNADEYTINPEFKDIDTLLETIPGVHNAFNLIIKEYKGQGYIVLGHFSTEQKQGWYELLSLPTGFVEDTNFIIPKGHNLPSNNKHNTFLTIKILPDNKDDFGRPQYKIIPTLIELSQYKPKTIHEKVIIMDDFYQKFSELDSKYLTQ